MPMLKFTPVTLTPLRLIRMLSGLAVVCCSQDGRTKTTLYNPVPLTPDAFTALAAGPLSWLKL